jgi:hypothetical protein
MDRDSFRQVSSRNLLHDSFVKVMKGIKYAKNVSLRIKLEKQNL